MANTTEKQAAAVTVRPLDTSDFWKILNIIRAGGKEAFSKIKTIDSEDKTAVGMLLLDVGMEFAQKELNAFFAGITGMSVEEYNKAPFDTTLSVLEQLEERENLAGFFSRAAKFIRKFSAAKA